MPCRKLRRLIQDSIQASFSRAKHIQPVVVSDIDTFIRLEPRFFHAEAEKFRIRLLRAHLGTRNQILQQTSHPKLPDLSVLDPGQHVGRARHIISPPLQFLKKPVNSLLRRHTLNQRVPVNVIHHTCVREDRLPDILQKTAEADQPVVSGSLFPSHLLDQLIHDLVDSPPGKFFRQTELPRAESVQRSLCHVIGVIIAVQCVVQIKKYCFSHVPPT